MVVVTSTRARRPLLEWSTVAVPARGAKVTGDLYMMRSVPRGTMIAVVDGAGRGPEAAAAAELALRTIENHFREDPAALVRRCHRELQGTRGAVLGLAVFHSDTPSLAWIGVGSVCGVLVRRRTSERQLLLTRNGLVGCTLPALRESVSTLGHGDVLVLTTDGIRQEFVDDLRAGVPVSRITSGIAARYSKSGDDRLVIAARYLGRTE